jgi:hypothetical protein
MAVTSDPALAASPPLCPNCGAPVTSPYCGQCGQRADQSLTVRGLLSDVLEDQLSVSGSAARTVMPLLFRPGFLTQEYLRGRIVRYAAPFRVFLVSTTLFVVAFTYAMHVRQPRVEQIVREQVAAARAKQAENARLGRPVRPVRILDLPIDSMWLSLPWRGIVRPLLLKQARINAMDPGRAVTLVGGAFARTSGYLMPFFVPAVAGLLQLVYWRRRRRYAEHVVFSLHAHAFTFVAMAMGALAQQLWGRFNVVCDLWIVVYLYMAMVRVYGDGWLRTAPRFVAMILLYAGLMAVVNPFLQAIIILTA